LPFAYDLAAALKPKVVVELGTHYGESYFGFCQSIDEHRLPAVCYAIDTWVGEEQSGFYGNEVFEEVSTYNELHYSSFSNLIRSTFDEAAPQFSEGSINLLHIDGLHTYEAVSHDFTHWLPKLAPGGIILLHDIVARSPGFEVWKLWEEISSRFQTFSFHHSWGLGVVYLGNGAAPEEPLLKLLFGSDSAVAENVRRHYVTAAESVELRHRLGGGRMAIRDFANVKAYACGPGGYEEKTSVSLQVETGKWHRITLELKSGSGGGPVRIDPCESPAVIEIAEARTRRARDDVTLWQGNQPLGFEGLRPIHEIAILSQSDVLRCFCFGFDSQFLLPELPPGDTSEALLIDLWLRIDKDLAAVIPALYSSTTITLLSDQYDPVRVENEALHAQLQRLEQEHAELTSEIRGLTDVQRSMQDEILSANREIAAADRRANEDNEKLSAVLAELADLGNKLEKRHCELEDYKRQIAATEEGLRIAKEERARMLASRSWRITAPLRHLGRIAGMEEQREPRS
jgi:hypothetical protein